MGPRRVLAGLSTARLANQPCGVLYGDQRPSAVDDGPPGAPVPLGLLRPAQQVRAYVRTCVRAYVRVPVW